VLMTGRVSAGQGTSSWHAPKSKLPSSVEKMPSLFVVCASLLVAGVFIYRLTSKPEIPQNARLPPGPKGEPWSLPRRRAPKYYTGKPVVGNLLDIPPQHSWLKFKAWADQYGPIFRLSIFGRNLVVVSTEKVANDLLRERGNLYSSREQLPMAAQLMSRNLRPLFLPYGGERASQTSPMEARR
jgi:hypothetical protein